MRLCRTCNFCHITDPKLDKMGQCRAHAPVLLYNPNSTEPYPSWFFPAVELDTCWCGEYKEK